MGSAATLNPFSLLGDNENDDPIQLAAAAPKAPKKVPAAQEPKPSMTKVAPQEAPQGGRGRGGRGEGRGEGRARGGRGEGRGEGRAGRGDRQPRTIEGDDGFEAAPGGYRGGGGDRSEGRVDGRSAGRGRGGDSGRGARGGGRSDRPRGDRQDGTGRGHEAVKRGGAGKGNWGAETPDDVEIADAKAAAGAEDATLEPATDAAEEPVAPYEPAPAPEPEEKVISLDEYEQMAAEKKAGINKSAPEAPKEGDMSQFSGMATYERSKIEEDGGEIELTRKKAARVKAAKEAKAKEGIVADVGFTVKDQESPYDRGSGGRGERGRGGRGGEGRGGDRDGGRGRGGRREGGREGGRGEGGRGGRGEGGRGGRGGEGRGDAAPARSAPGPSKAVAEVDLEDASAFPTL